MSKQTTEKSYSVSLSLLNKLVNYLSTRPYAEVFALLEDIKVAVAQQNTVEVVADPEKKETNVA